MNTNPLNTSAQKGQQKQQINLILLLKNPGTSQNIIDKFKSTFFQLSTQASQSLKNQQYQKTLNILNKCYDMLDFGKNILKDISKYWKLCIYGNLACTYQGDWKMQKCNKYCQKVQQQLQKLIQNVSSKQIYLNLTKSIIVIRFQHCAILSQLNQHDKALQMCKNTFPFLLKYIQNILQYAQSLHVNNNNNNNNGIQSTQTVQFSKQVSTFAQQILHNLLKNLQQQVTLNGDKQFFYYWQKTPQNNQQHIMKKYVLGNDNNACKRSILGVNKMNHWIDQFNIGTIMHMSQFTINDFQHPLPLQEYIFKDKLYQIVIYCSVAHFTVATQMRFIQTNKQKGEPQPQQNNRQEQNPNPQVNSIYKKYGYEQKSQIFKMSQLYHLKSINIMGQNIRATVPYISHLIHSYRKHYIQKKLLDPVIAIQQQSLISQSQAQYKNQIKQEIKQQPQNNYNCYLLNPVEINQVQQKKCSLSLKNSTNHVNSSDKYPLIQRQQRQKLQKKLPSFVSPPKTRRKSRIKQLNTGIKTTRQKTKSSHILTQQMRIKPKKKKIKTKNQTDFKNWKNQHDHRKKKLQHLQGQVQINHQSCTQIKVLTFKKKR